MKSIHTDQAPQAIGPYSQATYKNGFLFISGQLGIDPKTGKFATTFEEQARLVFLNLYHILLANNMSFANAMKVSVFMKDMDDFAKLNSIYAKYFSEPFPAREAIEVARLPKDGLIEISLIATD